MLKLSQSIVIAALVTFSSSAFAVFSTTPLKVTRVQPSPGGDTYFLMSGPTQHVGCTGATFLRVSKSLDNFDAVFASLLLAKAQNLNVYVDKNAGSCSSSQTVLNPYVSVRE